MTVKDLIQLLEEFPPELPVFFCPDSEGLTESQRTILPRDAVMNLVDPAGQVALPFSPDGEGYIYPQPPEGYVDALVIYPVAVREED